MADCTGRQHGLGEERTDHSPGGTPPNDPAQWGELILQNVRESIIVTDLSGAITAWNPGATALFGYTAAEMLGRTPAVLYPDLDPAALQADLTAILGGQDYRGDWRGRHKDGTLLWIDITTRPLYDADGTVHGFVGVARDITARKQTEERLRLLAAATDTLVATRDLRDAPQRIADLVVPTLADWCGVGLLGADGALAWQGVAYDAAIRDPDLQASRTVPAVVDDAAQAAHSTSQTQRRSIARMGSVVAVPLAARGQLLGVIAYLRVEPERALTAAQVPVLEDVAHRLALALDTARWAEEAHQAHAATEARASELEATLEAIADGVVVYDAAAHVVRVNGAARTLFGLDAEEDVAALPLVERMPRAKVRDAAGRALSPDEVVSAVVLGGEMVTGPQRVTLHLTTPDGRTLAVETSGAPLREATGVISGAVVVYRDVTEREALAQTAQQQAALLALARDAIIVRDPTGTVMQWNAGAEELYGWTAAEAVGQVTHDLLRTRVLEGDARPQGGATGSGADIDAALHASGAWEGRLEHRRRDGARVVVESRQALLRDAGDRPVAILEINRDVTARDALLAALAHDLKTPLTSIRGQAQLAHRRLERLDLPTVAPALAQLVQVEAGTQRLARLIDELGDVARLQMGAPVEVERQPADLVALVRGVVAQQEGLTGHHLVVETAVPVLRLLGDAVRLERVVGNLLANALKYSPARSAIQVRLGLTDDARGPGVTLTVQDQGIGIPAADLPHIFEHFHRARNVVGVVPGSGIGLASTRAIVAQHGGTLDVESVEGQGTTVRVWLPRSAPRHEASENVIATTQTEEENG